MKIEFLLINLFTYILLFNITVCDKTLLQTQMKDCVFQFASCV